MRSATAKRAVLAAATVPTPDTDDVARGRTVTLVCEDEGYGVPLLP